MTTSNKWEIFGRVLDRCESPIEWTFAHELLFSRRHGFGVDSDGVVVDEGGVEFRALAPMVFGRASRVVRHFPPDDQEEKRAMVAETTRWPVT